MPRYGYTIADASDRELAAIVHQVAGSDGQATTRDIADEGGLATKHPLTNVGVRLGYLRKIGILDRDPETRGWFLPPIGERFMSGQLTAAQRRALAALSEGSSVAATEALAALLAEANQVQQTMMRRQWQHGWANRRNGSR